MNHTKMPIAILLLLLLNPAMSRPGILDVPIDMTLSLPDTIRNHINFDSQDLAVFWAISLENNLYPYTPRGIGQTRHLKLSFDRMAEQDHDARALLIVQGLINPAIAALPKYLLWNRIDRPEIKYAIFAGQIIRIRDYQLIQATYGRANSPMKVGDSDENAMGILFGGNLTKEMSPQIALNFQLGYREMQNSNRQDRLGNVIMLNRSLVRKYSTGTFWEFSLSYRILNR